MHIAMENYLDDTQLFAEKQQPNTIDQFLVKYWVHEGLWAVIGKDFEHQFL